ncbi:unnamed protein product [Plutella xylostella]|uniref:(diamondback moth) hypothetical protein n=1 Tax=Plutella xylostella TaxID=51655 RepID=A0A8S4G615_PLUXY|nr:unnamed protein product [Plutella xylostella]
MDTTKDTMSLNSSVNSALQDHSEDLNTVSTKNYVKELLKSRIFLGRYVERRLVDKYIGYRDIIVLSPAETELRRDLEDSLHKLRSLNRFRWIGITDTDKLNYSPAGICLWCEIDNQPFGPFWFQVKTVQYRNDEVIVKVKCVRHITDAFLEAEPILTGKVKVNAKASKVEQSTESLGEAVTAIKGTLATALSITNVKEFVTFLMALVIAIFTGSSAFITFLGNFTLALVRETSYLIKNSTPMFLGFLDFISKIIGGFYILLAMFFRPKPGPPTNRRRISYYDEPNHTNFDSRCID